MPDEVLEKSCQALNLNDQKKLDQRLRGKIDRYLQLLLSMVTYWLQWGGTAASIHTCMYLPRDLSEWEASEPLDFAYRTTPAFFLSLSSHKVEIRLIYDM